MWRLHSLSVFSLFVEVPSSIAATSISSGSVRSPWGLLCVVMSPVVASNEFYQGGRQIAHLFDTATAQLVGNVFGTSRDQPSEALKPMTQTGLPY
jgi:hypothetical protein